ncbi:histidine kinase [Alteromonas pelagimontana]|uniref:Histidine kinase n=1 Tax=Alteromonas pelagimontana TaxID=1858656 RepID=A0A6M4MJF4_9ALTE|nr:histidine kinase [Alteromonas pelagimontana]
MLTEIMIKIPGEEPWAVHLPHLLLDTASGFCITLLLRKLYLWARRQQASVSVTLHIVYLLIAGVCWTQFKWLTLQWLYGNLWQSMTWFDFGTWTSASLTMLATWTAGYYGINIYLDNVEQRQKAVEATHLAKEVQLKMLRYQLNPHFMFNSINAICTLILKQDNTQAVSMLEKLCDLLRYSLYTDPLAKITVREEVTILKTYFDIEQCRFRDRLTVDITADRECDNLRMPSLLIQPLAENALKHGMGSQQSMIIRVHFQRVSNKLIIMISDTGKGFSDTASGQKGIGLKNCEERLNLIYPTNSHFEIGNQPEGGAWVKISLPVEAAE